MSQTDASTAPVQGVLPIGGPVPVPAQNQAPPPPDPRIAAASAMMPNLPGKGPVSNSLSTITACLGFNQFHSRTLATSTYLPCFNFLSLVLSQIDRLMVNTYRFGQSNPDWHPLFTQIYYGVIFVVHILSVRRTAQVITPEESDFLFWFESNYPISSLPIAGPIKHFFQSITTTSGPDNMYGHVYPSFPTINCTPANAFFFGNHLDTVLPSVAACMDLILHMHRFFNAEVAAGRSPVAWNIYRPHSILHRVATTTNQFNIPGATDFVYLPAGQMDSFVLSTANIGLPPSLDSNAGTANTTFTTVAQFLRLGTDGTATNLWFGHLISVMQRHAQFMKDSTNLASIAHAGLGACLPIIQVQPNDHVSLAAGVFTNVAAIAAAPAQAGPPPIAAVIGRPAAMNVTRATHFNITATSKFMNLPLIAEQFSVLSCINLDFSLIVARRANTHLALPTNNQLRSGPVWTLPDRKDYSNVNVLGQIQTYLAGVFHVDQRMTRN